MIYILNGEPVADLARLVGASALHAGELGTAGVEKLSVPLLSILSSSNAHFFISRVEKRYLLAAKLFDSLLDSGENAAVAWHHYNLRPLRLILTFKLAAIIREDVARLFWSCLLERKEDEARKKLVAVCEGLLSEIELIPDATSRKVLKEALEWAHGHPESIQTLIAGSL